jgi:hypothetical protein
LFAFASDPSGIRQMLVTYWYQYSEDEIDDDAPRYRSEMKAGENEPYSLLIYHNEENRAANALDGEGGWMYWLVTATDMAGNQSFEMGQPVPLIVDGCFSVD